MANDKPEKIFELGLVMAGAISAGAYTAGVMDFLLQALDAWHRVKQSPEKNVLRHEVRIKALSGASAGGMTAGVLAAALGRPIEPVDNLQLGVLPNRQNPLYTSWVERVGADKLLTTDDLGGGCVTSLLNSAVLDAVADEFMKPHGAWVCSRPYVDDRLHVFLTLANLNGIPYKIMFKGEGRYGHQMLLHKDYAHYVLHCGDAADSDFWGDSPRFLDGNDPGSLDWGVFRDAALATGAFPLALAPRLLDRNIKEYDSRYWLVPKSIKMHVPVQDRMVDMQANWQTVPLDMERVGYLGARFSHTLNVDGGTFDNEPLELARRCLAGLDLVNPREPDKAHRMVVLIDPFPKDNDNPLAEIHDMDIVNMSVKLLGAMKDNARFKPEELELAQEETCYSRFLIGPVRDGAGSGQSPIACGCLGGFSGFLSRKFRQHDFQLGRRNCQLFLWKHFCIPWKAAINNPAFKLDDAHQNTLSPELREEYRANGVPIIPLMPALHPEHGGEVKPLSWGDLALSEQDLTALRGPMLRRIRKLADVLMRRFTANKFQRMCINWLLSSKYEQAADTALEKIRDDLRLSGLFPY